MENSKNIFNKALLLVAFIALSLPILHNIINIPLVKPLKGDVVIPENVSFSLNKWNSGEYQEKKDNYNNSIFSIRPILIRINNEFYFRVFKTVRANGIVVGKKNYLYEENYIKAYNGTDFIGEDSLRNILTKLEFISDTLNKLNKQLIIVFAAGKASFYPEFIPDKYLPAKEKTNYKFLSVAAKKMDLNVIDFNRWFIDNKHKSKHPLYPQFGIHWSAYGSAFAADSIIRYIEEKRNIDAPNFIYDGFDFKQPFETDYDIADGMNLLFKLKSFQMTYPKLQIQKGETKPKVLMIADSYYWEMYGKGISNCFQDDHFWYYNQLVYPQSNTTETYTNDLDFKSEINNHEVIIIMATEASLKDLGWGFIEKADLFFKGKL